MPYVQGSMKELNRKTVFRLIAEQQEITRTEIADRTKSSAPTVLKITNFLQEEQIISLVGNEKTARGRQPQIFRFEPDSILGIGISYDGMRMTASLVNYYGEIKASVEENITLSFDEMMENRFPEMICQMTDGVKKEHIRCVGICLGASVDTEHSRIHLGGFSKLVVKRNVAESVKILSQKCGFPVYLFNDVNSAAVGEYILRKMQKEDLVYIYVGEGTGAGIILDGKLRTGQNFYSGEIAHMVFDPDFRIDREKPGWIEERLSLEHIKAHSKTKAGQIDYTARYISLVIANICNTMDIQNVVLGGSIIQSLEPAILQKTEEYLGHLMLFPVNLTRYVSEKSELVGAAYLAMEKQLVNILADND